MLDFETQLVIEPKICTTKELDVLMAPNKMVEIA